MMLFISITMILVFLLGMLAFACSPFLCVLGILISVVVLLLKLNVLPVGKLTGRNLAVVHTAAIVVMFLLGAFTSMSSAEGGINAYELKLDQTMALIEKDQLDKAWEEIGLIKEIYGASDNTVMLEVIAYIAEGSYDDAKSAVSQHSNKTRTDYYALLETVYKAESAEKNAKNLENLYIEAASHHHYWTYMQKMAGIALIGRNEFAKAEYYLLRAYEQEPSDFKAAYYLGVTCYEQQRAEDALVFFYEAAEREPDEETFGYIAWYVQALGE